MLRKHVIAGLLLLGLVMIFSIIFGNVISFNFPKSQAEEGISSQGGKYLVNDANRNEIETEYSGVEIEAFPSSQRYIIEHIEISFRGRVKDFEAGVAGVVKLLTEEEKEANIRILLKPVQ